MPGPYRAAAGKPPAVHKRPRRGQDPSLLTAPLTSAHPYRAAVGKPHAVRKRLRRGQDPSLRTAPSTSARTPYRAAVRERRQKNRGNPFSRDCLGSLYKHISA